jgi:hypothetical protein
MSRRNQTRIIAFSVIIAANILWSTVGISISNWLYLTLTKIGFPSPIVQLILLVLPLIFLFEIVIKILFVQQAAIPLKFIPTQPEVWTHLDRDELDRYTFELEKLGFVQLTDYTAPSIQGMARLFGHPQEFCFAEVGHVKSLPIFCTISCQLENNWSLAVVNNPSLSPISYAFFRQPRKLIKRFDNIQVNLLFKSILEWRDRVEGHLSIEVIKDIRSEAYFEKEHRNRIDRRNNLIRKSVILSLIEMFLFSLNPQSEWLGDYSKLKVKR